MKKIILLAVLMMLAWSPVWAATDTKLVDMTATTNPVSTDIIYVVINPSTTPLDRKLTFGNMITSLGILTSGGNAGTATALAANGANCNSGNAPLGVDAAGAVEGCFAVQANLSLLPGTYTNTYLCTYTTAGTLLDCNTNPATFATVGQTFYFGTTQVAINRGTGILSVAGIRTTHAAGGTGAGTAPIKLTSGNVMDTEEAGAFEFLNDTLYFTITTGPTRKTIAFSTDIPTAASLHLDDVLTALGIASTEVNFGAFTGSTITSNLALKPILQELETSVETKMNTSSAASYTEPGTNLPICRTGAGTLGGCTNLTDLAFSSYAPLANPQFTGVVDIPTDATTDAAGEITVDLTTDQLRFYGGAVKVLPSVQYASFVIPGPVATDDINIMKAPYGMTITGISCIVQGTTSVTGQLQECDSAGANCADLDADIVCDADGAADDGSLTDSAIASVAWIRWKTTSIDGTPTFLTVTFKYLVVAD